MPIGIIKLSNISNINSNIGHLYCFNDKLYYRDQEILDKGNQNEITSVGTITSGTWEGTDIGNDYITDTLTNKTLIEPIINKSGISDNTLLGGRPLNKGVSTHAYKRLSIIIGCP